LSAWSVSPSSVPSTSTLRPFFVWVVLSACSASLLPLSSSF